MRLGIDASNIRAGGGVTHLIELLNAAKPEDHGFGRVTVWGGASTLYQLEERQWLAKIHDPLLDRPLPFRLFWQRFRLEQLARRADCDVLFVPGGTFLGRFHPFVTMSQNMLPFDWSEARRYGFSRHRLKFLLLRNAQLTTFRNANGLIFLTDYVHEVIRPLLGNRSPRISVIPHGVDDRFRMRPREQKAISEYSTTSPLRVLYVSPVAPYKHQWHVMDALARLRQMGLPVTLELVGAINGCRKRFTKALQQFDHSGEWLHYLGKIPFSELHNVYHNADIFVFASTCENLPNTLLEAMAAGLPVACSNRPPMPEVLGAHGLYFDPEQPGEIANALEALISNPAARYEMARAAYERVEELTWERSAGRTFEFLAASGHQGATR